MMIKRMFKFTLSALLLALGVAAYAADGDDAVTLSNGTTMSWSQFVKDLKNPPTSAKGEAPDSTNFKTKELALKEVKDSLKLEQDTVASAKVTLTQKQAILTAKQSKYAEADSTLKAMTDTLVAKAQKNLDAAKKQVTDKQAQIADYNTQISGWKNDSTNADGKLHTAENTLKTLKNSSTLAKADTTITSVIGWLNTLKKNADNFISDFNSYDYEHPDDYTGTSKLYYMTSVITSGRTKYNAITLSFFDTKPDYTGDWKEATVPEFDELLYGEKALTYSYLYLYLGDEYKTTAETTSPVYTTDWQGNMAYFFNVISTTFNSLSGNRTFQTTVTKQLDRYKDPIAAQQTLNDIAATEANIALYNKLIYGVHGDAVTEDNPVYDGYVDKINAAKKSIGTLNSDIETLNNTTIPQLEKAVENAPTDASLESYKTDVSTAKSEVDAAQKDVDDAEDAVEAAEADEAVYQKKVETAQSEFNEADAALKSAQDASNANALAALKAAYQNVTLTADITVEESIGSTYNYTGTINGRGHVINLASGVNLCHEFSGTLNKVAINGTLADIITTTRLYDVAVWTGSTGRYYDDSAAKTDKLTFSQVGYAAREYFGVNFTDKQLVALADDTKVYNLTVYTPTSTDKNQYVVINKDNTLSDAKGAFTIPVNMFAQSADPDIAGKGLANVYYGENNECDLVKITDKTSFYCPAELHSAKVDYTSRTFKAGKNSVCVPFDLNPSDFPEGTSICRYDTEENGKFWFTYVQETIPANTPALVILPEGAADFTLDIIDGTTILATDESQIMQDKNSLAYGLFKNANPGEILGEHMAYQIYALTKKGTFAYAGDNVALPALRMVIYTPIATPAGPMSAPREIRIHDENGIDITDEVIRGDHSGIDDVNSDASELSIVGGKGEITINADADYGKVDVYSVDGRKVAVVDVVPGTNSVNVNGGLYIVMGKKVLVK